MNKNRLNRFFRRFGFEVHGTGYMQSIQKTAFKENAFEKQQAILGKAVHTIFDVGANRGDTMCTYRSLFSEAMIYGFEPFPETMAILRERTAGDSNMRVADYAVSDHVGETVFYHNQNVDTNSLLKSSTIGLSSDNQVKNKGEIRVNTTTLTAFCQQESIERIDILKLDIQGGELLALQGAASLLANQQIGLIYTECYFRKQYEHQPMFHDLAVYLEPFGYVLQDLYNPIYGKGSLAWCDAIFIPQTTHATAR